MTIGLMLRTSRCIIKPFSEEFLSERYVSWLNDADVVRYSEQRFRNHDLASCRKYMESFTATPHHLWAIISRDASLGHVGNVNAYVNQHSGVADMGILIGEKRVWRTGLGTEVWLAVCRHLLLEAKMRKITAGTLSSNVGMLGIMQNVGMRADGRRIKQAVHEGKEVDWIYGSLFREDME